MKASLLLACGLVFACLSPTAQAGGVGAMVLSANADAMERGHVICQHRIESSLRQLGFTVLDNHKDPCTAGLVVILGREAPTKSNSVPATFEQAVSLRMIRPEGPVEGEDDCHSGNMLGRKLTDMKLQGRSRATWAGALRDACQQLDQEVQSRAKQGMGAMLQVKSKTTLTLRWTGHLQPMPLLKITPYLQDFIGAPPELLSSDSQHCRYQFHLDDPHGIFKERLQSFLQKHWSIRSSSGDPHRGSRQVEFQLAEKQTD